MLQRLITLALLLGFCTGGLCALPVMGGHCPMQMGGPAGCDDEMEAQMEGPCCCEIDRDATPANPTSPATVTAAPPEHTVAVSASPEVTACGARFAPQLGDRLPIKPPDLLSLHSVLQL